MDRKVALVVNDEPLVRQVIAAALADAGFEVIQADDADAYARGTAESPIDIVVLPARDNGSSAVKKLRRSRPDLKALMLAERSEPCDDIDAVLHMPFHADDVRDAAVALAFGRCRCPSCLRMHR